MAEIPAPDAVYSTLDGQEKPPAKRPARRRAGFTLIELLVVVVIIGILAGIAIPNMVSAQDRARNAVVQANVKNTQTALEDYASEHSGGYPAPADCDEAGTTTTGGLGGLETYVESGALPKAPWSNVPQNVFTPVAGGGLVDASLVSDGTQDASPLGFPIGTGIGTLADPPANPTDYGVLLYSVDTDSQSYCVYGAGKSDAQVVVVGATTNNGQVSGGP